MNAPAERVCPVPAARRAARVHGSPVREILKVTQRPGMISLAGGLPAPQTFPAEAIDRGVAALAALIREETKR